MQNSGYDGKQPGAGSASDMRSACGVGSVGVLDSHPMPSLSPSNLCGSEPTTAKLRYPIWSQSRSGSPGAMQNSGYDGKQPGAGSASDMRSACGVGSVGMTDMANAVHDMAIAASTPILRINISLPPCGGIWAGLTCPSRPILRRQGIAFRSCLDLYDLPVLTHASGAAVAILGVGVDADLLGIAPRHSIPEAAFILGLGGFRAIILSCQSMWLLYIMYIILFLSARVRCP